MCWTSLEPKKEKRKRKGKEALRNMTELPKPGHRLYIHIHEANGSCQNFTQNYLLQDKL